MAGWPPGVCNQYLSCAHRHSRESEPSATSARRRVLVPAFGAATVQLHHSGVHRSEHLDSVGDQYTAREWVADVHGSEQQLGGAILSDRGFSVAGSCLEGIGQKGVLLIGS